MPDLTARALTARHVAGDRVERLQGVRGWWQVTLPAATTTTRTGDHT